MKKLFIYAMIGLAIASTLTSCHRGKTDEENRWEFFKQIAFGFDIDTVKKSVIPVREWKPVERIGIAGNYTEADSLYIAALFAKINAINRQTRFVLEKVVNNPQRLACFHFISLTDCENPKYLPLTITPDARKMACIIMHRSLDTYYSRVSLGSKLAYYTDRGQIMILSENISSINLKKQIIRKAFLSYVGLGDYNFNFKEMSDQFGFFNRDEKDKRIFGKQSKAIYYEFYTPKLTAGIGWGNPADTFKNGYPSFNVSQVSKFNHGSGMFSASVFNFEDTTYRQFTENDKYIIRTYLSNDLRKEISIHKTDFYTELAQRAITHQRLFNFSFGLLVLVLSILSINGFLNRTVFLYFDRIAGNSWLAFNLKVAFILTILVGWIFIGDICLLKGLVSHDPYHIGFFMRVVPIYLIYTFIPLNALFLIERQIFAGIHQFIKQQLASSIMMIGILVFCTWFIDLLRLTSMHDGNYFVAFAIGTGISLARFTYKYFDYKHQLALQESEQKLVQLRELKTRAELNALQSKINPHFLYNALNSIAGLAHADADKVEQMALALSKLFRYSVNKEDDDFTLVQNEVEMASIYLDIEKVRFGNKLQYQVKVMDEVQKERIPKFVIQPLVENAIKHGISKITTEGILTLTIFRDATGLHMVVGDNGPDFPKDIMTGYGLQSIYEKLDILYPGRYEITMQNGAGKNISLTLK